MSAVSRPAPADEIRSVVRGASRAALATLDRETGAPYASLVLVAADADLSPLLVLSGLARHTRNLVVDGRASLLIADAWAEAAGRDPLQSARVTLIGRATASSDGRALERFLRRHPSARDYAQFGDFSLWRLQLESAHLVAGFGRIVTQAAVAFQVDTSGAEALLADEAAVLAGLNARFAGRLEPLLPGPERTGSGGARIVGLDPLGLDLATGDGRCLHLPFPQRITTSEAAASAVEALVLRPQPRHDVPT